jgi:hypothetical protein
LEERLAVVLPLALAPVTVAAAAEPVPIPDDEAAQWPEGTTEVAIAKAPAEEESASESAAPRPAMPDAPLPSLDALVTRIPANVREMLDELFRVKFINVQRLPTSVLKE